MVLVILLWIQHIVTCANNTLAIFNWSSRYIILINAEDVELVCRKVKADGMGLRLRKVFFAAVASYWKQGEAVMTRKAEGWNDISSLQSGLDGNFGLPRCAEGIAAQTYRGIRG
jgi:hypothetical protein